jgi:hypothetical protein
MVTNDTIDVAKKIIEQEINAVLMTPTRVKENGVACHILFTLVDRMKISEAEASDRLSEILFHDQNLNEVFIDLIERIHMKQRMMGVTFSPKIRESKNRYIKLTNKRRIIRSGCRPCEFWKGHCNAKTIDYIPFFTACTICRRRSSCC